MPDPGDPVETAAPGHPIGIVAKALNAGGVRPVRALELAIASVSALVDAEFIDHCWLPEGVSSVTEAPPGEDDECDSCAEGATYAGVEEGECPKSERPCGHHCNHSWSHDICHWCGETFGEESPAGATTEAPHPHPFVPGIDIDDPDNPSPDWCNTCGERVGPAVAPPAPTREQLREAVAEAYRTGGNTAEFLNNAADSILALLAAGSSPAGTPQEDERG